MTRQELIAQTYDKYRQLRRQTPPEIVVAVMDMVLSAAGDKPLAGDEARLIQAHADCGWAVPYGHENPSGYAAWDDVGTSAAPMAAPAVLPEKCGLFDRECRL